MLLLNEIPKSSSIYYNDAFHQMLVKHFPHAIENELFTVQDVSGVTAEIYRGDFHGLLQSLRISFDYHRVNTEFNGLVSPLDYLGEAGPVRILNAEFLERVAKIYRINVK